MRALVLGGGAVKGAYQIGVLKRWMFEQGIDYEIMCGVSVGALNVAGFSQVPFGNPQGTWQYMHDLWVNKVNTAAIYKSWWPFGIIASLWKTSVYDSSPLQKLVGSMLDLNKTKACGRTISVGAVSLNTGENRFVHGDDPRFDQWVLASSSYPIFLTPITIDGELWADGGLCNVTPIANAIELGATQIDVIMCTNPFLSGSGPAPAQAVPAAVIDATNIMSDQIQRADLEIVGLKNNLAQLDPQYQKIPIRVVMPKVQLVADSLQFNPSDILRMIDIGYADANDFLMYD